MIQANELRIGNWLMRKQRSEHPLQNGTMHYQIKKWEDFQCLELPSSYSVGIPLTSDWLVKMGLKLERPLSYPDDQHGLYGNDYITIVECFHEPESFMYATRTDDDGEFKSGIAIKYVHQLQNLYYALTNEELTLNETE